MKIPGLRILQEMGVLLFVVSMCWARDQGSHENGRWGQLQTEAREALAAAMVGERNFVRIHAGEARAALRERDAVYTGFLDEAEQGDERYRVGAWRVLALSAPTAAAATPWIRRIEEIATAAEDPLRLLALESLNKLGYTLSAPELQRMRAHWDESQEATMVFLWWAEYLAQRPDALPKIAAALSSSVPAARARAAFVLRSLPITDREILSSLREAIHREPTGTMPRVFLLGAGVVLKADSDDDAVWRTELEQVLANGPEAARYQAAQALMEVSTPTVLEQWGQIMKRAEGDTRVALAWAILRVIARAEMTQKPSP
ncbi:MAG TPA: hypothetical protein PLN52_09770 [Opitutaceae bacterium]|nr:hypothetical protein [Opitutaceae bacterium]